MQQRLFSLILLSFSLFVFGQTSSKDLNRINKQNAEAIIGFLASDAVEGRKTGSTGGNIAAEYIVSKLKEIGVQPLSDHYFQHFEAVQSLKKNSRWHSVADSVQSVKSKGIHRTLKMKNILGMIPGKLKDESVIVGAHYDHLGMDKNLSGDQIFNGADDNASGVSAVLQIAKAMSEHGKQPLRTIIFAFWDGEEKGLLGSKNFVSTSPQIKNVKSYLNFDMIGRNNNEEKPNHVVFFYTAKHPDFEKWLRDDIKKHRLILEPDYRSWENPVGGSDNGSFAQAGIPILWYHTDGHPDYHQPSDIPQKINWDKLIDITKAAYLNVWKMANEANY